MATHENQARRIPGNRHQAVILHHPISFLEGKAFTHGTPEASGRVTIFEAPQDGWMYTIGFDAGFGITGRDRSSLTGIGIPPGDLPRRQVFQAVGQWASPQLARMCYGLGFYYNTAFICGEAQVGLATLQSLFHDFHYPFLYYQRGEAQKTRPVSEKLGYWSGEKMTDPAFQGLRTCLIDRACEYCDQELVEEMACLQWWNSKEKDGIEVVGDALLKVRLPVGVDGKRRSPDLVMGAAMAWWAACEVPKYDPPPDLTRIRNMERYKERNIPNMDDGIASFARMDVEG